MNKDLLARFLPRFIETAQVRLQALTQLLADRNAEGVPVKVRNEYHSLAGEASMLGLVEIGKQARAAENAAVAWQQGDTKGMMTCLRALRTLNKAVAALESAPADAASQSHDAEASAATTRVLVVDDSVINADAVVEALEDAGYSAAAASDMSGIDRAIAAGSPQFVLSDVNMPGLELADVVQHIRGACQAKVLLLSAMTDEELVAICSEVGADGFVSKAGGMDAVVASVGGPKG